MTSRASAAASHSVSVSTTNALGVQALTALVIGSIVGGGMFSLPQNMAAGRVVGIAVGWLIRDVGMLAERSGAFLSWFGTST